MLYLSVCSGIEAATVAWHPLGWRPWAFAEIDTFPSAVLAHHYPNVPNFGDMTRFQEWPDAALDVLVGGTPCQSFSVAGLRKGLDDPRGNLMLTFGAIAARYRPRWLVWENVPGVLSSGGGRDFGAFLGMLGELGYGFAYRVLDAQYFGLAQRRKRVFVVGHLGDWRRAAAVLFERASLRGDPAPRREAREGAAPTIAGGARSRGGYSEDDIPHTVGTICADAHPGAYTGQDAYTGRLIAHVCQYGDRTGSLDTDGHTMAVAIHENQRAEITINDTVGALNSGGGKPGQGYAAAMTGMQVRRLTTTECARLQGFPDDYLVLKYASAQEAHAAQVLHELWREAGTKASREQGWRTGIVAALLTPQVLLAGVHGGWLSWEMAADCAEVRGALPGEDHHHEGFVQSLRLAGAARYPPYRPESFEQFTRQPRGALPILSHARASAAEALRTHRLWAQAQARWPLRYAFAAPKEGRSADSLNPDGPRYKALGNSMAVPVMRWIGQRIAMVDEVTRARI